MDFTWKFICLFVLLAKLDIVFTVEPGLDMKVTKNGITYANTVANEALVAKLNAIAVGDQSGKEGKLSWRLSNIQNRGITGPNTNIELSPADNGLIVRLSNFGVSIHADWALEYKFIITLRPKGSVDVNIGGVSVTVTVGIGETNGRPSITARGCSASIGSVGLNIHGGVAAFLLNLFKGTLERKFKSLLQSKICDVVNDVINGQAGEELSKLKVNVLFGRNNFDLDYSLLSAPVVTNDYIQTKHKGEVYWAANRQARPCSPTAFPSSGDVSKMLYLRISECAANGFAYAAHNNNYLQYNVPISKILKKFSIFNEPQSPELNGDPNVELRLKTRSPPKIVFNDQIVTLSASGDIQIVNITPTETSSLITLNVNVSVTVQVRIVGEKVVFTVSTYSFDFYIQDSSVGEIDKQQVQELLKSVIDSEVIPHINEFGQSGIDLPQTGVVRFLNTNVSLGNGYIMVATDVQKV